MELLGRFLQIALLAALAGGAAYFYSATLGIIFLATIIGLLLMQVGSTLDTHRRILRRLQGFPDDDS